MKTIDVRRVAAVVAETLGEKFRHIRIIKVDVAHDMNRDGEDILRIDVVFEGQVKEADAKQIAGAARNLRPALSKIDADLFPLLSFVSKLDYKGNMKVAAR